MLDPSRLASVAKSPNISLPTQSSFPEKYPVFEAPPEFYRIKPTVGRPSITNGHFDLKLTNALIASGGRERIWVPQNR